MIINFLLSLLVSTCLFGTAMSITCFIRSNAPPGSSINGLSTTCVLSSYVCYSYQDYNGNQTAGCGLSSYCATSIYRSCITCNTSNCNALTPSGVSCYSRRSASSVANGSLTVCTAGISNCYSMIGVDGEGGCGSCGSSSGCFNCSSNYCNYLTSPVYCYSRLGTNALYTDTDGSAIFTGATGSICRSFTDSRGNHYAGFTTTGCNNTINTKSCRTCTTDNCNTIRPSVISCYSRYSASSVNNGTLTTCPTGVTTCYYFGSFNTEFGDAGCGSCDSSPDCTTCNTSYCNYQRTPVAIACHSRAGMSNISVATCTHAGSVCYAYTDFDGRMFAGCASPTICMSSGFNRSCVTCSTDYCNSWLTPRISCYARSSFAQNGNQTGCPASVTTCYTIGTVGTGAQDGEGNCGTCGNVADCTTCNTSYCNYVSRNLFCYTNVRTFSDPKFATSCSTPSCYSYSSFFGDYFLLYGGCGNCRPFQSNTSNCRTCYTDSCNSASTAGVGFKLTVTAAVLMLAGRDLLSAP